MTSTPLVSIIITTYNRADKLKDAIESLLNQTYTNIQIIVADDGSVDHTEQLVRHYPQVAYYYKENGGQASGRNLGFEHAEGDLIATLDSDDVWYPEFLEKCVQKLERDRLDFVFANWDQEVKFGETWDFLLNDPYLSLHHKNAVDGWVTLNSEDLRLVYLQSCPSPSSSLLVRKEIIASKWREDLRIGDDWYMFLKIVLTTPRKAAYTLERLWNKRVDEINLYDGRKWSEILERLYVSDLEIFIKDFDRLISKDEKLILQHKYMDSLVELAKHRLVREFNFSSGHHLLQKSFSMNKRYTISAIPKVFFNAFRRKISKK
ncbi:glycosyltransferase involved in cell wall biosynthesis [Pedobacter sp. UYEF25]